MTKKITILLVGPNVTMPSGLKNAIRWLKTDKRLQV